MNYEAIKKRSRAGWDKMTQNYQKAIRISTNDIHYGPNSYGEKRLKLLGNVRRKRVLDLGCGGGQNSIALAKMGAEVTAVDYSKEMLQYAGILAHKNKVRIKFINFDIERVDKLIFDRKFDIIFSSYAFQYVPNLTKLFKKLYRLLKPRGIFLFAMLHPLFTPNWRNIKGKKYALIENYFRFDDRSLWITNFGGNLTKIQAFMKTIAQIFDALRNAGFVIERIVEQSTVKNAKTVAPYYDSWYNDKFQSWPHTVIFKARKGHNA